MMTSAQPAASAGHLLHDREAGLLRLARRRGARAQRHTDVLHTGIAQIGGMSMTLRAVAHDHDLLGLDQINVGVAIVINAHSVFSSMFF